MMHILPNAVLDPYILGGVSYIYADADRIDVDSNFGAYLGGGLEWAIMTSLFKLFGEVVYRSAEIEAERSPDFDISGFTTNIGIKIHF